MTVPIGTIMAYAGDNSGDSSGRLDEQGWLICNGEPISQDEYPELFHIIGTYYGTAAQAGGFRLPDLRGRFVRGVDGGAERDPDAANRTPSGPGGNSRDKVGSVQDAQSGLEWVERVHSGGSDPSILPKNYRKLGECRPVNIYVNWIIKARDIS